MAGLGSLVVSLVAEASEFIAGFDKAAAKASSSSKAIDVSMASMAKGFVAAQAAMAAVQSTLGALQSTFDRAGQAMDAQENLGVAPEKFYAMQLAVEATGESIDKLPGMLGKLNETLQTTGSEAEGKGALLKALGLSMDELRKMDPSDAMKAVGQALQQIDDPAQRAAAGAELLGKGYKEGANQLKAFAESGDDVKGATLEQLQNVDALADSLASMGASAADTAMQFLGDLSPAVVSIIGGIKDLFKTTGEQDKLFRDLATGTIKVLGVALMGLIAGVQQLGLGFFDLGRAIGTALQGDFAGALKIMEDRLNASKEAMGQVAEKAKKLFSDQIDAASAAADAEKQRTEAEKKAAAERTSAVGRALRGLGGVTKAQQEGLNAQKKITDEIEKARKGYETVGLSAAEAQKKAFSMLKGVTTEQVEEFARYIDGAEMKRATANFQQALKDINFEVEFFGMSEVDKAVAKQERAFVQAGMSAEAAKEEVAEYRMGLQSLESLQLTNAFKNATDALATSVAGNGMPDYNKAVMALEVEYQEVVKKAKGSNAELEAEFDRRRKLLKQDYSDKAALSVVEMADAFEREKTAIFGTAEAMRELELRQMAAKRPELEWSNGAGQTYLDEMRSIMKHREELKKTAEQVDYMRGLYKDFGSTAVGALEGLLTGSLKGSEATKQLERALANMILQAMILRPMKKWVDDFADSLFRASSAGGNGGSGGGVGAIGQAIGDWIKGDTSKGGSSGTGAGIWDSIKGFFGFAMGGSPLPNSIVQVAEGGRPELYHSGGKSYLLTGSGGQVAPAQSGGASAPTLVQHYTIDARGADAGVEQRIRQAMEQTRAATLADVQRLANRGGNFAKSVGRA